MPRALTGSLTAVQFCYPAELPLKLNKNEHFPKVLKSNFTILNLKNQLKEDNMVCNDWYL